MTSNNITNRRLLKISLIKKIDHQPCQVRLNVVLLAPPMEVSSNPPYSPTWPASSSHIQMGL